MIRVLAVYRSPTYAPDGHFENDTRILDETSARLAERGFAIERADERAVEAGRVPRPADLYLNMCQGPRASRVLARIEATGAAAFVNRPSSVLNCHRRRLVKAMSGAGLSFPRTVLLPTAGAERRARFLATVLSDEPWIWIKRGDLHAESKEDVLAVRPAELLPALRGFAARGIAEVAVQKHVKGPVVKFYGVASGRFFRWYDPVLGPNGARPIADEVALRALAFRAAAVLGVEIFGGDVALPAPGAPVLLDMNDWPSFAALRGEAAGAIATYVEERFASWESARNVG